MISKTSQPTSRRGIVALGSIASVAHLLTHDDNACASKRLNLSESEKGWCERRLIGAPEWQRGSERLSSSPKWARTTVSQDGFAIVKRP